MTNQSAMDGAVEKSLRYREVQETLNQKLLTMLPKTAIQECAKELGYFAYAIANPEVEPDFSVPIDFAIYDFRIRGGTSAVERLVKQATWAEGSDERRVLDAMLAARFTLLKVSEVIVGVGMQVSDLIYERQFLLTDQELSNKVSAGDCLALRVLEFPELQMTTGVALGFDLEVGTSVIESLKPEFPEGPAAMLRQFQAGDRVRFTASLIQMAFAKPDDAEVDDDDELEGPTE